MSLVKQIGDHCKSHRTRRDRDRKLSLAVKRADLLNRHLEQELVGIEEDLKQLGQQGKSPHDPKAP
jgi:hypothetical protein